MHRESCHRELLLGQFPSPGRELPPPSRCRLLLEDEGIALAALVQETEAERVLAGQVRPHADVSCKAISLGRPAGASALASFAECPAGRRPLCRSRLAAAFSRRGPPPVSSTSTSCQCVRVVDSPIVRAETSSVATSASEVPAPSSGSFRCHPWSLPPLRRRSDSPEQRQITPQNILRPLHTPAGGHQGLRHCRPGRPQHHVRAAAPRRI